MGHEEQPGSGPGGESPGGCTTRPLPVATRVAIGVIGVTVLAGLNWVVGGMLLDALGGRASAENIREGRHFLASHGRLTEVPAGTFWGCYWYALVSDLALAAGVVAVAVAFAWSRRAIRRQEAALGG